MQLAFENFSIRPEERVLLLDGQPAPLGARAFDVLLALIERRDRVVTKNELLDLVWPGVIVEENNLSVQVGALRRLLGPQAIATIPGRGYRFVAPLGSEPAREAAPASRSVTVAPDANFAPSPRPSRANAPPSNLASWLPPLYGRDADIARVRELLAAHRVVSIVAASGVGKTRLAQAVAGESRAAYPDGVWWVELAGLHDGGMVAVEVARVLGFQISPARPALETVVDVLRDQSLLLLLDNCEHLLASIAPLVLAIAREAPGVRVLTTTLEPLKIDGEQRFRLEPLALPTEPGVAGAEASCAVQLFVERVRAVDPRFALTPANVERVVAICRRLDAIPLALEFAAARVPLLGVEGVHARLDERFRILTGGSRSSLRRHQTLRAALDFSHALLTAEEQACFRRLGVFAGSFAVETAQDVAADAVIDRWDVLDHLGALVDKSMVLAEHEGEHPRLRLLETARAYALEKLAEAGETAAVRQRHAQALGAMMAEAHETFWRWPDAARVARYAPEVDDLRAAIDWALDHDGERAIELCGNAGLLWMSLEMHPEGVRYCEAALARASPSTPPLAHGRLWHAFAWMLVWCQPDRSRDAAARAAALLRETGDSATLGMALLASIPRNQPPDAQQLAAILDVERLEDSAPPTVQAVRCSRLARLHRNAGRYAEARRAYAEGAALLAGAGATSFELTLQWMTGEVALIVGDGAAAVASLRETVRRRSAQQFRGMYLALALGSLATAELCQGEIEAARAHLAEAAPLLVRFEIGGRYAATAALLAASEGRWAAAAQLLGFGEAAAAAHPSSRNEPTERIAAERAQALLAANLSTEAIAAATAEGAALTAAQAYARALAADDGEIASPRS